MAEKVLNTRIQLKYDSYENWMKDTSVELKAGEVAIAYLGATVDTTAVTPDNGTHPVMMKVGPGKFSALPWLSALSADVHSWAKKSQEDFITWVKTLITVDNLDTYSTTEIDNLLTANSTADQKYAKDYADGLAKNYATAAQGALADTAVQSVVTGTEDGTIAVDGTNVPVKGLGSAAYKAATAFDEAGAAQAAQEAAETTASNLVDGLKANEIKANADAIAAIKDHVTVDSFADVMTEMAKYQIAGDYATKDEAQGYATTAKTEALEAVAQGYATKKEASDAQSAAEAAQGAADSANAKIDAFISGTGDNTEDVIDTLVEINKYITDDTAAFTQLSAKVDKLADGTNPVKEAEHADKADIASSLDDAGITQVQGIKVNSAGVADKASGLNADGEAAVKAVKVDNAAHADAADSATKATQDGSGNVITTTYETKTDATQKYNDAVSYADSLAKNYATAAQGAKADSAVQSVTFAGTALTKEGGAVSISKADAQTALGLGSAAYTNTDAYATSAQGLLADSAVQQITTTENNGLKVTGKNQIDIDTDVVFVFNCGSSTTVV